MAGDKVEAMAGRARTAQELFGWGIIQGLPDVARAGLEAGADAAAAESVGALSYAVGRDWVGCVGLALAAGADAEAVYHGRSLIERAVETGSTRCAWALLPKISLPALVSAIRWQTQEQPHSPVGALLARELSRREAVELLDSAREAGASERSDSRAPRL